jgi:hypothetical protein
MRLPEYMNLAVEASGEVHAFEVARTADYLGGGQQLRGSVFVAAVGQVSDSELIVTCGGERLRASLP